MEAVFRETDPVTGFIQFRPEPAETWQNRQPDTVTDFLRRISDIFRPENGGFTFRFQPEIHGILLQESSKWEDIV